MTSHHQHNPQSACNELKGLALWQLQTGLTAAERRDVLGLLLEGKQGQQHFKNPNPIATHLETSRKRLASRLDSSEKCTSTLATHHSIIGIDQLITKHGKPPVKGAPLALSFRGCASAFGKPSVAIIGSRMPTFQGRCLARQFATAFAQEGIFIWSGGAIGIDTVALKGGLDRDGAPGVFGSRAGAVLGSGLGQLYPPSNRSLFLSDGITLVSEFPLGQRAQQWCFPARNFTLAWLADYILVIESQCNSGSLITTDCAAHLGKGVGAVVWPANHPLGAGNQTLIMAGADAIFDPLDVVKKIRATIRSLP
jgi:DNA processing protein